MTEEEIILVEEIRRIEKLESSGKWKLPERLRHLRSLLEKIRNPSGSPRK